MQNIISRYLQAISALYSQGITTEHSFRGALESLLKNMTGYQVVNEAQHIACGAPDLTLLKNKIPIGYVEAKDIGKNLNSKDYQKQFQRYKKALANLIITDYLTFQFFEDENFISEISIGKIQPDKIAPIPENFNKLIEQIRTFSQYSGKPIANSNQLAEFMAAKTQVLSEAIEKTVIEKSSALNAQLQDFQEVLLPTMDQKQFADMYAQTIAYGMFVARLQNNSPTDFTRQQAANLIPKSNPFLRKLFQYIAGYDIDESISWIVDALADMFNYVDIDAIRKEFESKDKDPLLHFYEDFLTRYDKKLKNAKGAYYTPSAVVKFIVNAVDDILQNDFNLAKGLADNSKVIINDKEYHKVQILDPATGTGTFLAELVRKINQKFANNAGAWDNYVSQHLIPRLNGFEIMMSPYTMAHLKIELLLQEFGHNPNNNPNNQRLRIYLTDSLEEPKQNVQRLGLYKWLSDESTEAHKIKTDVPVMVILGNPPYNVKSKNKGKWILDLISDYKRNLNERNMQPLSDDYIKFIRFGQHCIEKNRDGILAYISNNTFIDGRIHRQMRRSLMETFDKIYILDLHGNAKKKETVPDGGKDENVFDIQQGVSINIFVKTANKQIYSPDKNKLAEIYHYELYGKRQEKYTFLLANNLQSIAWQQLTPQANDYFFVPKDFSLKEEYKKGFAINELCSVFINGIVTGDDNRFISFEAFIENNQKIMYRPFDVRYINYDLANIQRDRYSVMQNYLQKEENIGLILSKQFGGHKHFICFITNLMNEKSSQPFAPYYNFPLYLYQEHFGQIEKTPNLNEQYLIYFENLIDFVPAPEQIFDYIYAVLHAPSYREKYREFLKTDFPRIPYPKNAERFRNLATLGEKLRHLHLMENLAEAEVANFPKTGSNTIEISFTDKSGNYHDRKVWINDTQYFDNVPEIAWNFYIGGYLPARKWLKDRRGRTLSYEEIEHYRRIISVICETDRLMRAIDLIF
ncbi:MAG: N-6 DNA methylase [Tannerellaceae bacterium]|jgi:predicted helicase|nr:N-6 DNA methylase [Tannerellaceae bacterium]